MTTTRFTITTDAWTKVTTGAGRKLLRKDAGGEVLIHLGKATPKLDSPHFFSMAPREEFELDSGESIFARAKDSATEVVVIG